MKSLANKFCIEATEARDSKEKSIEVKKKYSPEISRKENDKNKLVFKFKDGSYCELNMISGKMELPFKYWNQVGEN